MKTLFLKLTRWCLDFVFPKHCLGCGQENDYLCAGCSSSLPALLGANCFLCGRRSPDGRACRDCRRRERAVLAGLLVAADWKNLLLRQIIYEYKYRFVEELSAPLAELMITFLERIDFVDLLKCPKAEIILVPVPLHGRRFAWRGFNQAELLAQNAGKHFNLPLAKNILFRSRHTLPQREIADQKKRAANTQNAFTLSPALNAGQNNFLKNKIIILVDDIATTGSTLESCARALAPLEPKEIWGLVIARG